MAVNVNDSTNSVQKVQSKKTDSEGNSTYTIITSLANENNTKYINSKALTFDSVPSTSVSKSADVTSYPVESGGYISDHVQIKNNQFSIEGVITNTPVRKYRDLLYSTPLENRVSMSITYLDTIYEARQPIVFVTEHQRFENVILKGITYSYKTEDSLVFELTFEQIRLAEKKAVRVDITEKKTAKNVSTGGTKKKQIITPTTLPQKIQEQNAASAG